MIDVQPPEGSFTDSSSTARLGAAISTANDHRRAEDACILPARDGFREE